MLRSLLVVGGLLPLLLGRVNAQSQVVAWPPLAELSTSSIYLERTPRPLDPSSLASTASDTTVRQIKPTHWKEGGLVGALVLGGLGVWLGNEICQNSDDTTASCTGAVIGGGLGGGILGFLIGALIGGQIPKHSVSEPADST